MLVYCSDVKNPKQNACITISQTGVAAPMVAKRIMSRPRITVLEISTPRYPTRARIAGIVSFRLMAAIACGISSMPD